MDKNSILYKKNLSILKIELVNLQRELFHLRMQTRIHPKLPNNNGLKSIRRSIARINTFITIKKRTSKKND
ncbi:MAG: 50S ribosomal protein L29 [Candidatus Dasytiphilus stammeri]